jgi:Kef-type K+ transport system membrane component KefB
VARLARMATLQIVLGVVCLVTAVWLVVLIVLDRLPGDVLYGVLALVETGLVVQLVLGLVQVAGDDGDLNVAAYVGYLVGSLLVLPIAFVWSVGERTRSGTGVLLVGVLAVAFLFVRLNQLWSYR